uniref:Uncharacterized protein n=1 Tax=viral metagenome TaxID=1070528 RepID=A0A6C0I7V5_9ZZZZ
MKNYRHRKNTQKINFRASQSQREKTAFFKILFRS